MNFLVFDPVFNRFQLKKKITGMFKLKFGADGHV